MNQISSSWSLFWKIFLPVFTLVFFGLGTAVFWFGDLESYNQGEIVRDRIIFTGLFLILGIGFFFTLMKLKRIDMDDQYIYVSNYLKTARYSFDQIDKISEKEFLHRKIISVILTGKGVFGKKIVFVPDRVRYERFFKRHEILSTLYTS